MWSTSGRSNERDKKTPGKVILEDLWKGVQALKAVQAIHDSKDGNVILLNFSHPLTAAHLAPVEAPTGKKVDRVIGIKSQIDPQRALVPQVVAMADRCELSPVEWQTLPIIVNPPSLHWAAVILLAELHGRCGYFPSHLRLRPVGGRLSPQFKVAEVLDLQGVRDSARRRRR